MPAEPFAKAPGVFPVIPPGAWHSSGLDPLAFGNRGHRVLCMGGDHGQACEL